MIVVEKAYLLSAPDNSAPSAGLRHVRLISLNGLQVLAYFLIIESALVIRSIPGAQTGLRAYYHSRAINQDQRP